MDMEANSDAQTALVIRPRTVQLLDRSILLKLEGVQRYYVYVPDNSNEMKARDEKETASRRDSLEKSMGGGGSGGLSSGNLHGSWQLLLEETDDQFRNFSLLQTVLEHPKTLSSHSMFQMDPSSRRLLIEGYYDFDDSLMRELIGRKLTIQNLNTQDLLRMAEMVMSNWGDPLRLYSMELDIKLKEDVRDLKVYIAKDVPERYWKMIKARYTNVVQSPKIISTGSSGSLMPPLPMSTSSMGPPSMTQSSSTVPVVQTPPLPGAPSLPQILPGSIFAQQQQFSGSGTFVQPLPVMIYGEKLRSLEGKFKPILKGILAIGSSLSDNKEFRNLFEDIVEKIIDPLKRIDMSVGEIDTLLVFLREAFIPENLGLNSLRHKDRLVHNWRSFLEGMRAIITVIFTLLRVDQHSRAYLLKVTRPTPAWTCSLLSYSAFFNEVDGMASNRFIDSMNSFVPLLADLRSLNTLSLDFNINAGELWNIIFDYQQTREALDCSVIGGLFRRSSSKFRSTMDWLVL
eukprot:gene5642-6511_t